MKKIIMALLICSFVMLAYNDIPVGAIQKSSTEATNELLESTTKEDVEKIVDEELNLNKGSRDVLEENIKSEMKKSTAATRSLDSDDENIIANYSMSDIKRVFFIDSTMISDYKKNKSFKSIISDKNKLCIPMETQGGEYGVINASEENQFKDIAWESLKKGKGGLFDNNQVISEKIQDYFQKADEQVNEIIFANPVMYHSNLVYISTKKGNEYIIPYFSAIQEYSFKNGEIYEADEFIKQLEQTVDEEAMTREGIYP